MSDIGASDNQRRLTRIDGTGTCIACGADGPCIHDGVAAHDSGATDKQPCRKLTGQELLDALDLTCSPDGNPDFQVIQDSYWKAKHEWKALEAAYAIVMADVVERVGFPNWEDW